jgi:hypothetical protein
MLRLEELRRLHARWKRDEERMERLKLRANKEIAKVLPGHPYSQKLMNMLSDLERAKDEEAKSFAEVAGQATEQLSFLFSELSKLRRIQKEFEAMTGRPYKEEIVMGQTRMMTPDDWLDIMVWVQCGHTLRLAKVIRYNHDARNRVLTVEFVSGDLPNRRVRIDQVRVWDGPE